MFIRLITSPADSAPKRLLPRKGGGGGGHGSGGRGGGEGRGGSSGSAAKGSSSFGTSPSIKLGGKTLETSPSSAGGGAKSVIPAGQPFSGREFGGGMRAQVYGSSTYGSGYPGISGRGVQGRGFPFVFYPVVFAPPIGVGGSYLYSEDEYGKADNTSRPGGPLFQASFSSPNSTFYIIADNITVSSLQSAVNNSCLKTNAFTVFAPLPYDSSNTPYPRPEEAIQYYRASSVVLTLDGYNNTAALGDNQSALPLPLPPNVDINLLACVNRTIGTSVPLVSAAGLPSDPDTGNLFFTLLHGSYAVMILSATYFLVSLKLVPRLIKLSIELDIPVILYNSL
ncbi:hypothetical protein C0989_009236 [Termitomyces sp. Mn162]|nr:hypothetical protein C0989_009236 [Termitomyces sp. Mn162]